MQLSCAAKLIYFQINRNYKIILKNVDSVNMEGINWSDRRIYKSNVISSLITMTDAGFKSHFLKLGAIEDFATFGIGKNTENKIWLWSEDISYKI